MSTAKQLAGRLIKAKLARDAQAETALWASRRLWADHFTMAIGQMALHKPSVRLIAEALTLAMVQNGIPQREITRAKRVLNITPPRNRKKH